MKSHILGADSSPKKVIGHTGDLGSFISAYWVFPETESAVVVFKQRRWRFEQYHRSSIDADIV